MLPSAKLSIFVTSLTYFFPLILFLALCPPSHAQTFTPKTTYESSSNFIEGKGLYVYAGYLLGLISSDSQTFMIDLSTSWNTTSPAFKQLAQGPLNQLSTSILTADNQSWVHLSDTVVYAYNITAGAWDQTFLMNDFDTYVRCAGTTDPGTGLIYIPTGYRIDTKSSSFGGATMMLLNMTDKTGHSLPTYQQLDHVEAYSVAWSKPLRGLLFFGGTGRTLSGLYSYNPEANVWSDIAHTTTGIASSRRTFSCFIPVYRGSKMIVFGGKAIDGGGTPLSDIKILDVATMTWTQGQDAGAANARAGAACAFLNDQLIVWGGINETRTDSSFPQNTTIVYNFKTGTWTSSYVALVAHPDISAPTPSPSASTSSPSASTPSPLASTSPSFKPPEGTLTNNDHILAILVAVFVVFVVLVAIAAGFTFRAWKKRAVASSTSPSRSDGEKGAYGTSGYYVPPPPSTASSYPMSYQLSNMPCRDPAVIQEREAYDQRHGRPLHAEFGQGRHSSKQWSGSRYS